MIEAFVRDNLADAMYIRDFKLIESDGRVIASATVDSTHYGEQELWFSVRKEFVSYVCVDRLDAFLVAMLYPAMLYGEDIVVEGCVSQRLLFNLNNYAIPLLQGFSDSLKKIKISAVSESKEIYGGAGVGTGFSAGVDSFCTIYDRYVLEGRPAHKVSSLTFFNVGSNGDWLQHGSTEFTRAKFQTRYAALSKFAEEVGLDFLDVDTNLHFFHHWWHSYSHSLKAAAVVLLLQKHYSKYYYSSAGMNYSGMLERSAFYKNKDIGAYCDPLLLPLLSTESVELVSDGTAYTRSEKVLHVLNYEPVTRYLNVCVDHVEAWENCSVCDKCLRTLLTLDVSGNLESFDKIFRLDLYREKRTEYIERQIERMESDPFAADNIKLAQMHGIKLPSIRWIRLIRRAKNWAGGPRRLVSKAVRLVRQRA
ncbi:hypothetical protein [Roseateles sp.]|uniref:hypothetical protein n=1 Tax=Roseateles sp. TaxID=1971397 RepID=UPI0039EA4551